VTEARLGREEGLGRPEQRRLVHPDAVVGDAKSDHVVRFAAVDGDL
jgi:hypothetical protein